MIQLIVKSIMAQQQRFTKAQKSTPLLHTKPLSRQRISGSRRQGWLPPIVSRTPEDSTSTPPVGTYHTLLQLILLISALLISYTTHAETPVFVDKKNNTQQQSKQPSAIKPKAEESIIIPTPSPTSPISDVFGSNLFGGSFSNKSYSGYNPDYSIGIGDKITLKLWGAYNLETVLTVDAQGNIFIPKVGPVTVVGVRNGELDKIVKRKIKKIYRANVQSYVNLAAAQPVKIFVSGFVMRPGMYSGLSSDSVLNFLDQAGGIDPERGSFIEVIVKRGSRIQKKIDLYDFLLNGNMPLLQFSDGDTILISARKSIVRVDGLVQNKNRFEIRESTTTLDNILAIARSKPEATHVRITRNKGSIKNVEYYPIEDSSSVSLYAGDEVYITADKKPGTITVRVEGEHDSPQEYVLPYGTALGHLLKQVKLNKHSNPQAMQLFRESVKKRQKELLEISLQSLQSSVLTARSATNEEAKLREQEADLILQWVERARNITTRGQVVISDSPNSKDMLLENGDVIKIPRRNNLVMVHGEVIFPNTVVFNKSKTINEYIANAGGYTQSANTSFVIILHPDGSFERAKSKRWSKKLKADVASGDEILVLPRIDFKRLQITKDISQIIYQIALSAAVVLAL